MSLEAEIVPVAAAEAAPGTAPQSPEVPVIAEAVAAALAHREAAADARRAELRQELGMAPTPAPVVAEPGLEAMEKIRADAGRLASAVEAFSEIAFQREAAGYNADFEVADFQKVFIGLQALQKIAAEGGDVEALATEISRITEGLSRMYAVQHRNVADDAESIATVYQALGAMGEVAKEISTPEAAQLGDLCGQLQGITENRYRLFLQYLGNRY